MNWPNNLAYTEAVRDYPHISLQDPKLKGGKSQRGGDGRLKSYSGGFSIVFPIVKGSHTFALRCWMEDVGNAEVRYKEISAYLKRVRLPYFVDFEYVPKGILVMGNLHPITRMQWAAGVSLRDFISRNLKNPRLFKVVADKFQEMVATLHKNQIAHGDLQDGNILLNLNRNTVEIKLIDYDSLFVPKLRGQPDKIRGLPEYQHPVRFTADERTQATEKLDYFSELVICLSFLALSEKPDLWRSFEDKTERGLLFAEADFKNPGQSAIFRELANLSPDVQQLASTLKDFCAKTSIDQLEPLEAILPKSDPKTHTDRGFSLLKNDQYQEALAEFQEAIALDSKYERAQFGRGHVYRRTKKYGAAINTFEKIIQQDPKYKEAHHGLALAYYESGDNSKATTAANAALRIDPHYQPPRELLRVIKSSISTPISRSSSTQSKQTVTPRSTTSTTRSSSAQSKQTTTQRSTTSSTPSSTRSRRHSTNSSSRANTSQAVRTNSVTNIWRYMTDALGNNRHAIVTGVLGLAFAVCLIVLLTRGDMGGEVPPQITQLKEQLMQKDSKIQELTSTVQTLEKDKEELAREKDRLQADLENLSSDSGRTLGDLVALRQALSDEKEKNQDLQEQLSKKDDEIWQLRDGNKNAAPLNENRRLRNELAQSKMRVTNLETILQNLHNERTKVLEEKQGLRDQLTQKTSESENLTERVQQLQKEKIETQRQNQKFGDQIRTLRAQSEEPQQNSLKVSPEPPKKVQNYRSVITRAASSNNQGVIAFNRGDYNKAINHFTTAIKADSQFAIAHYNLGCAYLHTEKYHDAIRVFDKVVSLDPEFIEAYYNRSLAYLKMRQFQKAK